MSRWQFLIYSAAFLAFSFIVPFFFGFLCIVLSAVSLGIFLGLLLAPRLGPFSSPVKGKHIQPR